MKLMNRKTKQNLIPFWIVSTVMVVFLLILSLNFVLSISDRGNNNQTEALEQNGNLDSDQIEFSDQNKQDDVQTISPKLSGTTSYVDDLWINTSSIEWSVTSNKSFKMNLGVPTELNTYGANAWYPYAYYRDPSYYVGREILDYSIITENTDYSKYRVSYNYSNQISQYDLSVDSYIEVFGDSLLKFSYINNSFNGTPYAPIQSFGNSFYIVPGGDIQNDYYYYPGATSEIAFPYGSCFGCYDRIEPSEYSTFYQNFTYLTVYDRFYNQGIAIIVDVNYLLPLWTDIQYPHTMQVSHQSTLPNYGLFTVPQNYSFYLYFYEIENTTDPYVSVESFILNNLTQYEAAVPTNEFNSIFVDDFEDGDTSDWSTTGGYWSVENGKLKTTQGSTGDPYLFAPINVSGDYEVSVDVYWISGNYFEGHIAVDANFTGTPQYYYRMWMTTYTNPDSLIIEYVQVNPQSVTVLAQIPTTVSLNTWYNFKIERQGTTLFFYLDNNLMHTELNASDPGNQFSLLNTVSTSYYDNYTIKYNKAPSGFEEQFSTDVIQSGIWNRTDTSVFVNTTSGYLEIVPNSIYDDRASINFSPVNYPVILEYRSILKSGGLNYVLPSVFFQLENGTLLSISRTTNLGWGIAGFGWITGYGAYNENEWWDVKLILNGTGLSLYTKPSINSNYTFVTSINYKLNSKINSIIIGQAWDAWIKVDWIRLLNIQEESNNSPPTASNLQLNPSTPTTTGTLTASWTYNDTESDPEGQAEIRWYKNNVYQPSFDNSVTITSTITQKDEVWYYTLRVFDGKDYSILYSSPSVTIVNTAPTASNVQLTSPTYTTTDLVASWTFSDVDNDVQTSYIIYWYKDLILQSALTNLTSVPATYTSKGQMWNYSLQVFDGEALSPVYESPVVIIQNSAPTLSNVNLNSATPLDNLNATWTYSDTDNDPVVSYTIYWYKDGVIESSRTNTTSVPFVLLSKGQQWYYTIQAFDGESSSIIYTSLTTIIVNIPPTLSLLAISPSVPVSEDSLTAIWNYYDEDGDPQTAINIRWYKNGVLDPSLDNTTTVPSNIIVKGDSWYFTLQVFDGESWSGIQTSPTVTVSNTAPTASNIQLSSPAYPISTLNASYTFSDVDADSESGSLILWYKNGVLQPSLNNSLTVSPALTIKGEVWNFTLRVSDGENYSILYYSPSVTIQNSVPTLYNVQLTDPGRNSTDLDASWTFNDADNDLQLGYEIIWYKNNIEQVSLYNQTKIQSTRTTVDEIWNFTVTVSDGVSTSILYSSQEVTILSDNVPAFTLLATNVTYTFGDTGYTIIWNVSDNNPTTYEIYQNSQVNVSSTWASDIAITFGVDGLSVGLHNITIVLSDGDGFSIKHTIFVEVKPVPTAPVLTVYPSNFTIIESAINLSFSATDDNPITFILYQDSVGINSSSWVSGVLIDISVPYLNPGLYNFTIVVFDADGLFDSYTFFITVNPTPVPPVIVIAPQDFQLVGGTQFNVSWAASDSNPDITILYLNGTQQNTTTWISDVLINFYFTSQPESQSNFTIVFFDTDGLSASSTVIATFTKAVLSGTPPQITGLPDSETLTHEQISSGNLSWTAADDNPTTFVVFKEGIEYHSGTWTNGTPVSFVIEGLTVGEYNFTIKFSDADGLSVSSSVIVKVKAKQTSPPVINTYPSDISYTEGSTGNFLNWVATDDNPSTFIIYKNGVVFSNGSWTSGNIIAVQVDGLTSGTYEFKIVINDQDGLSVSDTVIVTVNPKEMSSQKTTTSTTVNTINTTPFMELDILIMSLIVSLLLLRIIRKRNK